MFLTLFLDALKVCWRLKASLLLTFLSRGSNATRSFVLWKHTFQIFLPGGGGGEALSDQLLRLHPAWLLWVLGPATVPDLSGFCVLL